MYYVRMYVCMHVYIGYVPSGSRPAHAVESKSLPISQVPSLFSSLPPSVRAWRCDRT